MPRMDPKDREDIENIRRLAEENNTLLRKINRRMNIGAAWRIFYWLVVIGLSIGALYFIQPYVDQLLEVYSGLQENINSVQGVLNTFNGGN